uniref:Terminase, large subunit n=1 Tax=Enterobacteria phage T3 TaxID=10759 RepID=TERL_BPT3|nr:RecName: Full=Terminase, large subunit; AltName: Full=DNA-packaging protein; AltName: Full=Gene product 19; Short=gp19; Includes: RecName: Full=ATPase; Includes: RecName: Full=Endonuclease [Enterobacteria phage T3]AAA92528.1 DNA-packaging protein B [Enterobacteria phage T3]
MSTQSNRNALVVAQLKGDFVAFLFVLWKALNLPVPTKCQIDMAKVLANGDNKKFILQAFRGIGKSFITCAFVVWTLWRDPQLKILIVSASKERADLNSIFIKNIIDLLPFLDELKPSPGQRDSVISFDVGPAKPDHSPSVKSVGITGQLTGSRADIIIADDVEIPSNSATQGAREKLWTLVQEFRALLKPLPTSRVIYLGTPQTEMTLYKELEDNRGYTTIIWPALYPRSREEDLYYGERLAPMLREEFNDGFEMLQGQPTDPVRFDMEDLRERELEYGKAGFTLQFMLNPNLSDAEKYPLRLRDAIVCGLDFEKAPMHYQWLPNRQNRNEELPNVGLKGDDIHSYHSCSQNTGQYQQRILVIDPSGRGKDETGYAVLFTLNGYIYLMEAGGFPDGYSDKTLESLAKKANEWKVQTVVFESNFGDGMFGKVFSPVLLKHHAAALEEIRARGMKELRICDTLEPVLSTHRLVIRDEVIREDYQTARDADGKHDVRYSLFYQLTRMAREKGAVAHDDRLDAFRLGVEFLRSTMELDAVKVEAEVLEAFLEEHMEHPIHSAGHVVTAMVDGMELYWEDDDVNGDRFINW